MDKFVNMLSMSDLNVVILDNREKIEAYQQMDKLLLFRRNIREVNIEVISEERSYLEVVFSL